MTTTGLQGSANPNATSAVERWMMLVLNWILGLAMLAELVIMFGNIVLRALTGTSWVWNQEAGQLALTVITFIGGAMAYSRGEQMAVCTVLRKLPQSWQRVLEAMGDWVVAGTGLLAGILALSVLERRREEFFLTLPISQAWFIVPMVAGMLLLVLFALFRLSRQQRHPVITSGLGTFVVCAIFFALDFYLAFPGTPVGMLWMVFIFLAFLLLSGVPIGFVLPLCSMVYLYYSERAPLEAVPQNMFGGIISVVLLAIPFFILAGYIMTEGGISRRLADFVNSFFGHLRGGLLQVTVICMFIVSGLSGSKMADVAAVGLTLKEMVRRSGYNPAEFTAVLASATIMGETIPPSIIILIMGSITSLSIGALFLAGIMPAMVIGFCLMLAIYLRARYYNMPTGTRGNWRQMALGTLTALPALAIPACLIGGIVAGFATPTEASSTAVVYSLGLACLAYREINIRSFWRVLIDSSVKSGMILFIVSAASAFSWSLTVANLPHAVAEMLLGLAYAPWLFMLGTIFTLVIMGALLEGVPAVMIFAPLLMPIAQKMGFHLLQYSMVLIIAMGLGTFLPGIGIGMYVACAVTDVTMEDVTKRMLQYIVVVVIGLLLVAFVPAICLTLPNLLLK